MMAGSAQYTCITVVYVIYQEYFVTTEKGIEQMIKLLEDLQVLIQDQSIGVL